MSNTKISALTSASTPLAGTETLPIVQSKATTKVNLLPLSLTDQMYVGIAISVVVTLLRIVTTQPISEK